MTHSTTNTAARELLAAEYELDGADYVAQCIRRDSMLTTMEARCLRAISAALRSKAAASEGDGKPLVPPCDACGGRGCIDHGDTEIGSALFDCEECDGSGLANTSKQAASEGDDGDGVANCAECGAFLESVRPGKHQHPTCSQANTSKQAAGEAVAWGQFEDGRLVGLAFQRNEAGECTTPLYTTPPRHPADGGMAMQWPRGVLNRDKTLELLISHNEWRRGKEGPQTDPRLLGLALEATIAAIQAGSP